MKRRDTKFRNGTKVQWLDPYGDEPVTRYGRVIEDGLSAQYLIAERGTTFVRFVFKDDRTLKEIT